MTDPQPGYSPPTAKERGSALVIVIILALVVTALCTTMLITSNTDRMIATNERDAERALFASKAGLNYAYNCFKGGTITPTSVGAAFNSYATAVSTPLDGAAFTGTFYDISAGIGAGQVYKIVSTGTYKRGTRTTELVFQIMPEALKYGYMAFNDATLHRHTTTGASSFAINSTIFSDNTVSIDKGLAVNGSIVASGSVSVDSAAGLPSSVAGDVFAYSLTNAGSVAGKAKFVASVKPTSATPNVIDNTGLKYVWYNSRSNPASSASGGGTIAGGTSRYVVKTGDTFNYSIFQPDGTIILNPPVNVVKYIPPPTIDYKAMKTEADLNEATYFTTSASAVTYLISKRVTEVIVGQTLKTIKVGTVANPEMLYVRGDLKLTVKPSASDSTSGTIKADGIQIEGGMYMSGDFDFTGNNFSDPSTYPAGYYELKINALPYCYPAIMAYPEPTSGTVATWTPANTPAMTGGASKITMSSGGNDYEGYVSINGLTYSESETHIHHTKSDKELVTFNGAELAYKIHNCDYFQFTYDKAVGCTKFLGAQAGSPQIVSYRELR